MRANDAAYNLQFKYSIIFFLLSMCFCTIACGVWETGTGRYFRSYLPWDLLILTKSPAIASTFIDLRSFLSYAIVLNLVMNVSHYVSIRVIRLAHSLLINGDQQMCCGKSQTPAKARNTELNEELGQIEYIFSDKTGTLTQNVLSFNKCSIGGTCYGDVCDQTLVDSSRKDPTCQEFFRLLALCHTLMLDEKNGKLEYQAQSPDEGALFSAVRNFGFVFKARTPNSITIEVMGKAEIYELLYILDFNDVRKRMSVILRGPNGKIRLYCKGADSVVFDRLQSGNDDIKNKTKEDLNRFAGEGLRTLCLAIRDIDETYFEDWRARYQEASATIAVCSLRASRKERLDKLYEEIEQNLMLLGATAIEDKLQDGVPQTLANLAIAGIKIWVLTGDKQETAISIGYSCQLLTDDMVDIFIVDGKDLEDVELQLVKCKESLSGIGEDCNTGYALVVNGHSVVHALHPKLEKLFLDVGTQCKTVICCRVNSPQKALVVDSVKKNKQAVTLAIGDGANDVPMIKAAHIGVGISGREGMEAVSASDYSIAQFRFLERLLLVHGRWSNLKMAKLLGYCFYMSFAVTLCHFWFAVFCGFSSQALFDPMFISVYNLLYTFLLHALDIFNQDINDVNSLKYPKLSSPGYLNLMFNKGEFFKCAMHGCITSCVVFFIPYGTYFYGISQSGHTTYNHQLFGCVVATILVSVVIVQIALDTAFWTVISFVIPFFALRYFLGGSFFGSFNQALGEVTFWLTLLLCNCILMMLVVAWRSFFVDDDLTLLNRAGLDSKLSAIRFNNRTHSRRSLRSGYAFAHQEGYGELITSGQVMSKTGLDFVSNDAANDRGIHSSTRQSQHDSSVQQQRPAVPDVA